MVPAVNREDMSNATANSHADVVRRNDNVMLKHSRPDAPDAAALSTSPIAWDRARFKVGYGYTEYWMPYQPGRIASKSQ